MTTSLHVDQKNKTKKTYVCLTGTHRVGLWSLQLQDWNVLIGKSCAPPTLAGLQVPSTPAAAAAALSYIGRSKSILNCGTLFHSGGGRLHEHLQRVFFFSLPLPSSSFLINHRDTSSVSTLRRTEGGNVFKSQHLRMKTPSPLGSRNIHRRGCKVSPLWSHPKEKKGGEPVSLWLVFSTS